MPVVNRLWTAMSERRARLSELVAMMADAPAEWGAPVPSANGHTAGSAEAMSCSTWAECEAAWRDALYWRQDLSDALAVLLTVCTSTQQAGNQLFLDLIGSPGSAKTTLCQGLLVSHHCIRLENVTKILSGFKKPGDGGADCSFLARANGKTWVTCEFDVLAHSPQYAEVMGKIRRIFDGETSATYGNSDEDRVYLALRTPWIRAGTPRMVDHDQSALGDRFLRFVIADPPEDERRAILRCALRSEKVAMLEQAHSTHGSTVDPKTRKAHALTGGYVDYLRAHIEELLPAVSVGADAEDRCVDLAELSADLRARPVWGDKNRAPTEPHESKELPTRLARQFCRLATCLAVVLNRRVVDAEVLRVVRKVALDTACGHTRDIVQWLCSANPGAPDCTYQESGGLADQTLQVWTGMPMDRLLKYLAFLRKVGVLEFRTVRQTGGAWVLTQRVYDLYLRVMRG